METLASFAGRVKHATGHELAAIPEGTADDALSHIVARRGPTYVVYVGPWLDSLIGGESRPISEFRRVTL